MPMKLGPAVSSTRPSDSTAISPVDSQVPLRNARSSTCWEASPLVRTTAVPRIEHSTPMVATDTGTWIICSADTSGRLSEAMAPSAMVAMIEPTYDSYRSAPMPATSPTLSPTLSAMVAGLRASSSGMFASTLPTRSAPTSAALVKMPPPSRANSACSEAPMPKVIMIGGISTTGTPNAKRSRYHQMLMSSSPSPTTVMPMTVPDENATRRPAFSDSLAPWAVRALARVAIDMPMKPASAEKKPPVMNANGTNGDSSLSP